MITTVLELIGLLCLAAFAFIVWAPLALLVVGAAVLLMAWLRERGERE